MPAPFNIADRSLNIDEIFVGYIRKYNDNSKTRRQIMTKVYNMSRDDNPAIESISGKKGVYKIKEGFIE